MAKSRASIGWVLAIALCAGLLLPAALCERPTRTSVRSHSISRKLTTQRVSHARYRPAQVRLAACQFSASWTAPEEPVNEDKCDDDDEIAQPFLNETVSPDSVELSSDSIFRSNSPPPRPVPPLRC